VKTEDSRFKIKIRNESDWILYDVDFKFTWKPENRFIVRKLENSSSPVFDIERSITAKIMPQNVGSGTIQFRVEFKDPIFPNNRDIMELWQINVEIN
jgi:hypothetical protein